MKICLIFICLLISPRAFTQFLLKGLLVDTVTNNAVGGASVFLSNTSIGTVTNGSGTFELQVPAGKYDLVISHIGYETQLRSISGKVDDVLKVRMIPKAEVLGEVVVGGYEKDGWEKYGKFFTELFVGTNELADKCTIKNYKVLRFRNNKKQNKITVTASEPVVIENKALGYEVKYQLENFEYDFDNKFLIYLGYPLFTQLPGSKGRLERWMKNREEAYDGSLMHFMRSLYRNKLAEEGFQVRRLVKTPNEEKKRIKWMYRYAKPAKDSSAYYNRIMEEPDENSAFSPYTITGDSIAFAIDSITAGMLFDNYLHIFYPKKQASLRYHEYSPKNDKVMSELSLAQQEPLQIQSNGNFYSPINLITNGYWAWSEKISSMLPFDYNPEKRLLLAPKFKGKKKSPKL